MPQLALMELPCWLSCLQLQDDAWIRVPRSLSLPGSCQCVTDINQPPGPFWVSDFWQITQPTWEDPSPPACSNSNIFMQHLPEDIVTDICTWAQTHSAAPALPPAWVMDALQSLFPQCAAQERENAAKGMILTQQPKVDCVFITD